MKRSEDLQRIARPGGTRPKKYSGYDIHGNVKSMLTQVPALKNFGQEFHRVDYYYDLVSGKVNEVHYQPKGIDRLYYRYRYDADNRLVTAETSRDYVNWERDAKYFYYPHGPLKRVETGHRKVQGTDYFYTVHGWLKGVNGGALNETYDVGRDGDIALSGNPNAQVARDAFGFTLDYYDGDYKAVGTTNMNHIPYISGTDDYGTAILENGLYNGNIARMATALLKPDEQRLPVLGYAYKYDQLNRIRENFAYLSSDLHTANSWSGITGSDAYLGTYSYDANGNIASMRRYDGSGVLRDHFTAYNYTTKSAYSSGQFYNYKGPQNRLDYIDDAVTSGTFTDDMDDQSAANYGYDEIGNLVKDEAEEIDKIEWTVYGKVKSVLRESGSKKPDLYFYYNGSGQRYMKVIIPKNQSTGAPLGKHDWKATYYQHDAQGNILAVYDIKGGPNDCGYDMFLSEHVLYGSSRLGTSTYNKYHMGYTSGSLAYPVGPGFNVCYTESHENEMESGREPMGGNTTGPIGGGNHEILLANGPHRVAGTRTPIVGVNLPWAGDDENVKPTREGTFFVPGRKRYEFSNHLGNVLVTISDMPIGVDGDSDGDVDYYMPDVKTTSDYEPFGAALNDRTFAENGAKYDWGYNGQYKDDELHGDGNSYEFEYRIYDPRIGKFLSVDPLAPDYPYYTPYSYAANQPIHAIDLEGLENPDDKNPTVYPMHPFLPFEVLDGVNNGNVGEAAAPFIVSAFLPLELLTPMAQGASRIHMDKANGGNIPTETLNKLYPETAPGSGYGLVSFMFDVYVFGRLLPIEVSPKIPTPVNQGSAPGPSEPTTLATRPAEPLPTSYTASKPVAGSTPYLQRAPKGGIVTMDGKVYKGGQIMKGGTSFPSPELLKTRVGQAEKIVERMVPKAKYASDGAPETGYVMSSISRYTRYVGAGAGAAAAAHSAYEAIARPPAGKVITPKTK